MEIRFEDHRSFHRSAGRAAVGAALVAAAAPASMLVPAAAAGGALALLAWPGVRRSTRKTVLLGLGCAVAAVAWAVAPPPWAIAAAGGLFGVALAQARSASSAAEGARRPGRAAVLASTALAVFAMWAAAVLLPAMFDALSGWMPAPLAEGVCGAVVAFWAALASIPLHLAIGGDPIETKLATLRPALGSELRLLAERAMAARRDALRSLPDARSGLPALLDALAMAALDLCARAAELGRAAPPGAHDELSRRVIQLEKSAAAADDEAARRSYERAAQAMSGQLEHLGRVRRARDRAVARLHEDVAQLERARFALALLRGADAERGAAELDLLHERLQHAALTCEAQEELSLQ